MMMNTPKLCALLLAIGVTVGCSSGTATSSAATDASSLAAPEPSAASSSTGLESSSASQYPGWASAVVPDYPNAIDRMLVRDDFYQIDSADDSSTVLAWYKSHVPGNWGTAGSSYNGVLSNANGVRIEVDKLGYGNQPIGKRPRTMICLNRVVDGEAQPC